MPQTKAQRISFTVWDEFLQADEEKLKSLHGFEEQAQEAITEKLRGAEASTISELTFCLGELYETLKAQQQPLPSSPHALVLRDILGHVWKEADLRNMQVCRGTQKSGHYPIAMVRDADAPPVCPKCSEREGT